MSISFSSLPGNFGVEVKGIDLVGCSDDEIRELLYGLYKNRIAVVRSEHLSADDMVVFARRIGDPLLVPHQEPHPEIIRITNEGADSLNDKKGAAHWHTDQSFTNNLASITMLYSVKSPDKGGQTRFCDMVAAYNALPESTRGEIDALQVEHRHGVSIVARPGDHVPIAPKNWDKEKAVVHPLVRRHPITGVKTLYAITGTSQGIIGLSKDQAQNILESLCQHAFQDEFLTDYRHSVGDLLLWDNPTTMHSASPIAAATGSRDLREIRRISLRGRPPVFS